MRPSPKHLLITASLVLIGAALFVTTRAWTHAKKIFKGEIPGDALYKFGTVETLDEGEFDLAELRGKTVLITNVASKCGYTDDNYKKLSQLYDTLPDSFVILAFPSNEFFGQEPGNAREIRTFLTQNYNVPTRSRFKIMQKINVNGKNQHPLYKLLKLATNSPDLDVKWNFETKFIVAPDGKRIERHTGAYDPLTLRSRIEEFMGIARGRDSGEL